MKKNKWRYDKVMEAKWLDVSKKDKCNEKDKDKVGNFLNWASAAGFDYVFEMISPDESVDIIWVCLAKDLTDLLIDVTSRGFSIISFHRLATENAFDFVSN